MKGRGENNGRRKQGKDEKEKIMEWKSEGRKEWKDRGRRRETGR